MRRWLAAGVCAVVVVVGVVKAIVPPLTAEHGFPAEINQPASLFSSEALPVRPRQAACLAPVVMEQHSDQAQFKVALGRVAAQPLQLRIDGSGVRVRRRIPARYADGQVILVDVPAPAAPKVVRACVRNLGRRTVGFVAANDRTIGRAHTRIGQRVPGPAMFFGFFERRPVSLWQRLGVTMQRASVFRPGIVGPWLLWPLAILFFLGIPAATIWAVWRAAD
jgi:hypothetical protein